MDLITAMRAYVRVVEAGSFTKAADSLLMQKASVTRLVQQLETHLRTRLLHRTTRKLTVTDDGAAYYERAVRLLQDLEDMESSISASNATPRGRLRIDVSSAVGALVLAPRLPEFFARHPEIQIDLGVSDRPVDLVAENVDAVIRGGEILDQSLVARRIGMFDFLTCASPTYLARHGTPTHPRELESPRHSLVRYFSSRTGRPFPVDFNRDGERHEIQGHYHLSVNDGNAYLAAGLAGLGIIQAPTFMLLKHLRAGQLRRILPDWNSDPLPVWVVYPPNRHVSARLRVFVDWVVEVFSECHLQRCQDAGEAWATDAEAPPREDEATTGRAAMPAAPRMPATPQADGQRQLALT